MGKAAKKASGKDRMAESFAALMQQNIRASVNCPEEGMICTDYNDGSEFEIASFEDGHLLLYFRRDGRRKVLKLKPISLENVK